LVNVSTASSPLSQCIKHDPMKTDSSYTLRSCIWALSVYLLKETTSMPVKSDKKVVFNLRVCEAYAVIVGRE
jgi:hypothetical protein